MGLFRRLILGRPRKNGGVAWLGVARVAAYCLCVSLAFSAMTLWSLIADARESALRVGRDLLPLRDMLGSPREVNLNGAKLFVGAKHLALSVPETLNRFDRYCQQHSSHFEEDFDKLTDGQRAKLPEASKGLARLGILHIEQSDAEGIVACLAGPDDSTGIKGLVSRVKAFAATGDLSRVGSLRYIFARKSKKSGTNVITIWNEGPVDVSRMLFPEGDVPGSEIDGVDRPPGSLRTMDAEIVNTGYGMRSYSTRDTVDTVITGYEKRLTPHGWKVGPMPDAAELPVDGGAFRLFTQNGALVFVSVDRDGDDTLATVITMGTRGDARVGTPRHPGAPFQELDETAPADPGRGGR